ncbi:hypothetical protein CC78DRAFT_538086 [Lojkania enalia]|uniref:ferric-chelate reductase (NADPH) n=1 Tax=Lojkania enalia TaxID=147567 RepID=A0A9P4K0R3_9PLEO|nr:hypothetical protein CC78DRAFT_538086 [Didymosphaeria enalia]
MEITQLYAIAAGGILLALMLVNSRPYIEAFLRAVSLPVSKHLTYPRIIHRHRYFGPWSRADVIFQLFYIMANSFCVGFRVPDVSTAGLRAANLSLINMVPNFAGSHLSFLADILGVPLSTYQQIHRSSGIMSVSLLIFHVLTIIGSRNPFPLQVAENLWGLIGGSSLFILLLLSSPFLRSFSYEIFIRIHQALAILSVYSIWRHLELKPLVPRIYAYIFTAAFLFALLLQGFFIYRSQARIVHFEDTIKVELTLSRPLKVKAGQYINLWIPSLSFWSIFQSHPFTVASWSYGEQDSLDLFIEPRGGITQKLLHHFTPGTDGSKPHLDGSLPHLALFSGPHGISAPVGDYETVLMVASGSGIVAQLPYLKQLIYGYNAHKSRTRRVHLVWQLETRETGIAVQSIINEVLTNDAFHILSISMYIRSGGAHLVKIKRKKTVDRGIGSDSGSADLEKGTERVDTMQSPQLVNVQNGSADLEMILREEMEANLQEVEERGEILVMVSGTDELRDQLRDLVRTYLDDQVRLLELEYQPA